MKDIKCQELIKMIEERKIKNNTKIRVYDKYHPDCFREYMFINGSIYDSKGNEMALWVLLNTKLKLIIDDIKEDKTIDIQAIEELDYEVDFGYVNCGNMTKEVKEGLNRQFNNINKKINEIIKVIKQLDKRIKE